MDFKENLKKYWFIGLIAIGLLVYVVVYCVQAYQNRTIYVDAKQEDGKSIVYTLNGENYYADDFYDDLYASLGKNASYFKWQQYVVRNAYETDDDITTQANNAYTYIKTYNEESTISSSLKQSGYANGIDDLQQYCLDMIKQNKLLTDFYTANFDTYAPKYIESSNPKKIYHILVKVADISEETDDDGNTVKTANMTEEEQAKYDAVVAALANGDDFKELAKTYSDDTTAENGGYLGIYTTSQVSSNFVSEFATACNELETGTISDPVLSQYGYHFIYTEEPTNGELKEDSTFISSMSSGYTYSNVVAFKEKSDELGFEISSEDLNNLINDYLTQAAEELNPTTSQEESE